MVLEKILSASFFIFCSLLLLCWSLPDEYRLRKGFHRLFAAPVIRFGLDNFWSLFAPNPVSRNFLLGVEVDLEDGRTVPFTVPEFGMKDGYQYTPRMRFIKWHNCLLSQSDEAPKRALCQYVLETMRRDDRHGSMPVAVNIIRFFEPDPENNPLEIPWFSQVAYSYTENVHDAAGPQKEPED